MFETMMNKVKACGDDVDIYVRDNIAHLTINDFEGFDDNWEEVYRDYENPKAVKALTTWLLDNCASYEDDYYIIYHFDGFDVKLGYTSFDI